MVSIGFHKIIDLCRPSFWPYLQDSGGSLLSCILGVEIVIFEFDKELSYMPSLYTGCPSESYLGENIINNSVFCIVSPLSASDLTSVIDPSVLMQYYSRQSWTPQKQDHHNTHCIFRLKSGMPLLLSFKFYVNFKLLGEWWILLCQANSSL